MLLCCGMGAQTKAWHVLEPKAPMYVRVYLVTGGNTQYKSGQSRCILKKNWLYFFPSHAPYEMSTDPENPLNCLHLHLSPENIQVFSLVSVSLADHPEIAHLLQSVQDAILAGYPLSYLNMLAGSLETLCQLKGLLQRPDPQTAAYLEVMEKTYRQNIPLETIAASMGYTTEYFIRSFKKRLGVPPHQYAISLRMRDAARMLSGSTGLDQISLSIGYGDGHSFANAFRQYYGISPSAYRRHCCGYI